MTSYKHYKNFKKRSFSGRTWDKSCKVCLTRIKYPFENNAALIGIKDEVLTEEDWNQTNQ